MSEGRQDQLNGMNAYKQIQFAFEEQGSFYCSMSQYRKSSTTVERLVIVFDQSNGSSSV